MPANPNNPFSRPGTGPYVPPGTGSYPPADGTGNSRNIAPNYQVSSQPTPVDVVSIVLGIIAFLAVLGLIPLWLAVWNTWMTAR
jgi:hypothetical protein